MSFSDEQYSYSDDDEEKDNLLLEPWENLIQYLSLHHLENLRNIFKNEIDFSNKKITKEEFIEAIDTVTGNSKYSLQASSLFDQICKPEETTISWPQFLDYLIENGITDISNDTRLSDPNILPIPHVGRQSIVKIVPIETENTFSYAIVSKYGKVGLYTGNLIILTVYKVVFSRCDLIFKNRSRNEKSIWITDAIFLPKICIFVVSNSARSLSFYDASKQRHIPLWLIEGMPNAIYSMEYYSNDSGTCKLFLGEDFGSILVLNFLQVKEGLFRRKFTDKLSCFYWRELGDEATYIQIEKLKNMHSNIVLSLLYNENTNTLISTSRDHVNSVILYNTKEKKKTYCFKITEGVSCFSISFKLHLFLTGNDCGTIYIWNLYVTSQPITILSAHKSSIVDVQILNYRNAALSCSKEGMLKLWDLKNYECLQTISIKFPCFDIYGKLIEWGVVSIYPGPKTTIEILEDNFENSVRPEEDSFDFKGKSDPWKRSLILICCCNYVAKINIFTGSNGKFYENNILPPPPIQNEIIVPNDWKSKTNYEVYKEKDSTINIDPKIEYHPILKSIMKPDFLKSMRLQKYDINEKKAKMEIKKMDMIKPVLQCAPFVALDLHEIDEVKLSPNLPIPKSKESQKIYDRVQRLLSADSIRTEILSDRSSKSKSSKSSLIEFDIL